MYIGSPQVQIEDEGISMSLAMQSSHSDTSEGNAVTIYTCSTTVVCQ